MKRRAKEGDEEGKEDVKRRKSEMGKAPSSQLIDIALKKFVMPPCKGDWEVECEMMVTVLYVALTSPSCSWTQARDVLMLFTRRWIEGKVLTLEEMVTSFKEEWKCSATAVLILLCANLSPEEWNIMLLKEDVLSWQDSWLGTTLPEWLSDATACLGKISTLTALLKVSATILHNASVGGSNEHSFVGSLTTFLNGSKLYKEGGYHGCLDALRSVSLHHCGPDLQGWISWLKGLCLAKMNNPYTAVLKLQEAVDRSVHCLPAIYNISQVFSAMGKRKAEAESLSLITQRVIEQNSPGVLNLQSAILSLHHTPVQDLPHRALFLLALNCLEAKEYTEASKHLTSLISQLEVVSEPVTKGRTLVRREDEIPSLPETQTILVMAALAHLYSGDFNNVLKTLEGRLEDADSAGNLALYESSDEGKMMCLTAAVGCLVRVDAFSELDFTDEALTECSKLEQGTIWISGIERSMWDQGMLKMRALLYKIQSSLHAVKQDHQSQQHYKRRSAQCHAGLRSDHSPAWNKHLSVSHKMLIDIMFDYITEKLSGT